MSRNCAIPVSEYLGSAKPEEHQLSSCADKPIGEDNEFFALVNWGIRKSAFWCTFTHRSGNDGHAKSSVFPIRTPDHFLVTSLGGKPLALLGQNVTKNHPCNDAKCETEVTLPLSGGNDRCHHRSTLRAQTRDEIHHQRESFRPRKRETAPGHNRYNRSPS